MTEKNDDRIREDAAAEGLPGEMIPERAVLVSVPTDDLDEMDPDSSLNELEELLKTAGGISYGRMIQTRQAPDHATCIGRGKLAQLAEICRNVRIDLVVFDCELTPSQVRNIEDALDGVRVIDRTMLILDIFAARAKTAEGILQVAIANMKYTLPRLTGQGKDLSRLGGGIGTRGPGESKLEIDRRRAKEKIRNLEKELAELAKKRKTQRKSREKSGVFRISLAGYTNAGKSTLLNALCDESVLAENKLFATLDPVTRRWKLPQAGEALLTDTVGFINRLPHHLVEAFRSTLDEVVYSDLVLVILDAADEKFLQKLHVTESILYSLFEQNDLPPAPFLYVLNKTDLPESRFNREAFPGGRRSVCISAGKKTGLADLTRCVEEILSEQKKETAFLFPHEQAGLLSPLYKTSQVKAVRYGPDGVYAEVICDEKTRGSLARFITAKRESEE